jgi:predicted RNase H-like HicB family nuclease
VKVCIQIRRNDRGVFVACCPSLPGCVSIGQDEEQAKARLEEAIRGYLASVSDFVPEQIQQVVQYLS